MSVLQGDTAIPARRLSFRGARLSPGSNRKSIPLPVKGVYTAFVAVLVPYYLSFHGPANFLWICDIALLLTVAAVWLESRFLASMQLVAVLLDRKDDGGQLERNADIGLGP